MGIYWLTYDRAEQNYKVKCLLLPDMQLKQGRVQIEADIRELQPKTTGGKMFKHFRECRKRKVDLWGSAAWYERFSKSKENLDAAIDVEQSLEYSTKKPIYSERKNDLQAEIEKYEGIMTQWRSTRLREWLSPCKHGGFPHVDGSSGYWNFMYPLCRCKNFVAKSIYRGILRHNFRNGFHD